MEKTGTFLPGFDGSRRFIRRWMVEKPRGLLFIVHGYAEHSGRYEHTARRLNKSGFSVIAMDHYGHGKSDGKQADIPRFEYYVNDLLKLVRQEAGEKEERNLPVILLGHSMGGAVTAAFACRYPEEAEALIFSGAAIRNESGASPFLRTIAMILGTIAPNVPVKPFDAEGISKDPEVVKAYKEDPLVFTGSMKARMGRELLRVTSLTPESLLAQIRRPTLIMHGGSDRLVDPQCSRLLYKVTGAEKKQLYIFDGLFHEIFNEPEQEMVLDTTVSWLEELF